MKKIIHLIGFLALSVFLNISCSKYSKMLDFDFENMDIDGNMNWGIPLINADYGIEEILNQFDNKGYIKTDPNGDYYFEITSSKDEYLNAQDLNKIDNNTFDFSFNCPPNILIHLFTQNYMDVSTQYIKFHEATLKSGYIKFDFSRISPSTHVDYEIMIKSSTIFNADGSHFVKKLSKSNPIDLIPCEGLKMKPNNGIVNLEVTITMNQYSETAILFSSQISMIDVVVKEADVELLINLDQYFYSASSFSLFSKDPNLQATLHSPALSFDIVNTFGTSVDVMLSKVSVKSSTYSESILIHDNTLIEISQNFIGSLNITDKIKRDIFLTSNYDSLFFEYIVLLPVGKRIKFYDNSIAEANLTFSVPFDITIYRAMFTDTLALGIPQIGEISILDTVKIRTAFTNSLPVGIQVQIILYNSVSQKEISAILSDEATISGSYNGMPVHSDTKFVVITNERIRELKLADQMIIQFSIATDGKHYTFNQTNSISARVGANIKTANHF